MYFSFFPMGFYLLCKDMLRTSHNSKLHHLNLMALGSSLTKDVIYHFKTKQLVLQCSTINVFFISFAYGGFYSSTLQDPGCYGSTFPCFKLVVMSAVIHRTQLHLLTSYLCKTGFLLDLLLSMQWSSFLFMATLRCYLSTWVTFFCASILYWLS